MYLDLLSLLFGFLGFFVLFESWVIHCNAFNHPHTYKTNFNPPKNYLSFNKAWKNE